jgi:ADP-ribose pyrophosphatase
MALRVGKRATERGKIRMGDEKRQTIWKGTAFQFDREEILLPNGRKTVAGLIRHPGSAAIVPVLQDGSVVLIHQFRYGVKDFLWEIPAGTMDPGEDPLACAKRELQEESGYAAHRLEKLGELWVAPGYSSERIHLFLATHLTLMESHPDEDECLTVHTFPFSRALEMVERDEIREAMTIVALQKAYPVWKRNKSNP